MIREEYRYEDISDYLLEDNDLLIVGKPSEEDRSTFFYSLWTEKKKLVLELNLEKKEKVSCILRGPEEISEPKILDLSTELPAFLEELELEEKSVLLDISSLNHILIMFLTKQLLTHVFPQTFFAAYIRPECYCEESGDIGFALCDRVCSVEAVPGFIKRESKNQTLCAFLGFEGIRLNGVLEAVYNVSRFIPVMAFPSGSPQWYNVTIWNCMEVLQSQDKEISVQKCLSESVFGAVQLLERIIKPGENLVLTPLGTRPHSLACAIFASTHPNVRVIYDYVIENTCRTKGIGHITIYHLSSFIKYK